MLEMLRLCCRWPLGNPVDGPQSVGSVADPSPRFEYGKIVLFLLFTVIGLEEHGTHLSI